MGEFISINHINFVAYLLGNFIHTFMVINFYEEFSLLFGGIYVNIHSTLIISIL